MQAAVGRRTVARATHYTSTTKESQQKPSVRSVCDNLFQDCELWSILRRRAGSASTVALPCIARP